MTTPAILGLGTERPPHTWSHERTLAFATRRAARDDQDARRLAILYRRAGVDTRSVATDASFYPEDDEPTTGRRMACYAEQAGPLATRAATRALQDADLAAPDVTHLVTVSCTGFAAPGVEFDLIRGLDLSPSVQRAHIGFMGCHGLVNAIGVAAAFARAPSARVLVCAVELCSLHFRYGWDPDRLVANALFADGAAAVVVGPGDAWTIRAVGSRLMPDSADAMTWRVGDHGFEMTLSARVPDLIGEHLRPWVDAWLGEHGLAVGDVGSWAIHPGGPRIVETAAAGLGLPREATAVSREVFAACGNMSSPTVGFLVERLRASDAPLPCVALAFGPGLVAEAVLFA